jgi:putative ABC transport system permease protein
MVSPGLLRLLGIPPRLGRTFTPEEPSADAPREVVLSHGLWSRRFGSDPGIVDRTLRLDDQRYTVVGVMPPEFEFLMEADLWLPLVFSPQDLEDRGMIFLRVLGRFREGVDLERAWDDMENVSLLLEEKDPMVNADWRATVEPLRDHLVGDVRATLLVLFAAVGFVLLVACANIANLLLARSAEREGEIAIRRSLGAGRSHLLRQALCESLTLAFAGGALGLLLAYLGVELLVHLQPGNVPRLEEVAIDLRVLGFTLLLTVATGVLFGLAPILRSLRIDLGQLLKEGAGRVRGSLSLVGARSLLVIFEVAVAMVLLIGAGLTIRSFQRLQEVDPGFVPGRLLAARIALAEDVYAEPFQRRSFIERLLTRLESLPDVETAGMVTTLPLTGVDLMEVFVPEGVPASPNLPEGGGLDAVSPGYFRAMGISVQQGRPFDDRDRADSEPVAIVNQALAELYWPGEEVVGKRIQIPGVSEDFRRIVGVVGNVKRDGPDSETRREAYVPYQQFGELRSSFYAVARATPEGLERLPAALRSTVFEIDPNQPVANLVEMEELFRRSIAQRRVNTWLMAVAGGVGLVLALLGIYGVLEYSVVQQSRAIGIRRALGARTRDVLLRVLLQGLRLTGVGLVAGLVGAFLLTRLMESLLFGVAATDPWTFTTISLLFVLVALTASLLPALRATRVNPIEVLRHE